MKPIVAPHISPPRHDQRVVTARKKCKSSEAPPSSPSCPPPIFTSFYIEADWGWWMGRNEKKPVAPTCWKFFLFSVAPLFEQLGGSTRRFLHPARLPAAKTYGVTDPLDADWGWGETKTVVAPTCLLLLLLQHTSVFALTRRVTSTARASLAGTRRATSLSRNTV